jgi:NAD(P)-dependent dehydrogenase (short-subunit alcohol dehydrogenase family)
VGAIYSVFLGLFVFFQAFGPEGSLPVRALRGAARTALMAACAALISWQFITTLIDTNIKGTYHMMVAAVRHMQQYVQAPAVTGRIVNVTSVDAFKAHPQNAHYAATKAAVVSLTRSFAQACAKDQILVNSVAPAGFATERAKQLGFLGELAAANPLGRAAEPAEIAEWIVMMGSSRNSYATGENVIVSGGYIYA